MITLDTGETIRKIIRRKSTPMVLEIFFVLILAIVPLLIYYYHGFDKLLVADPLKVRYLLAFFYSMWLLICWIFGALSWMEYYLNAWIITDARVMRVKQTGFLRREMEGVRFDKIKEVILGAKGTIKIILDSDDGTLTIENAPHPESIKEMIVYEQKMARDRLNATLTIDEVQMGMV